MKNQLKMIFSAINENEAFARCAVAAFAVTLNPTLEEINDMKTAVSEAVTNCIVHGYEGRGGEITVSAELEGTSIHITVQDHGVGIADIEQARQPFYTTRESEERSGMGFTVMESVMDEVKVYPTEGGGVTVEMSKKLVGENAES